MHAIDTHNAAEFLALADKCERRSTGHGTSADRECLMEAAIAIRALTTVLTEDDRDELAEMAAAEMTKAAEPSAEPLTPSDPNPLPQAEGPTAVFPAATSVTPEAAPAKGPKAGKGKKH